MKILALEFSSGRRSVAIGTSSDWQAGQFELLSEAAENGAETRVFSLIEEGLARAGVNRAEIDVIAVGNGPGSYTGIRVAIAVAQGWQLASGIRLLGVSSVEAIAARAAQQGGKGPIAVAVDAQRGEFYLQEFELVQGGCAVAAPLAIVPLAKLEECAGRMRVVGPELSRWITSATELEPDAAAIGKLAAGRTDFLKGEFLEPVYLREIQFVKAPPSRQWSEPRSGPAI